MISDDRRRLNHRVTVHKVHVVAYPIAISLSRPTLVDFFTFHMASPQIQFQFSTFRILPSSVLPAAARAIRFFPTQQFLLRQHVYAKLYPFLVARPLRRKPATPTPLFRAFPSFASTSSRAASAVLWFFLLICTDPNPKTLMISAGYTRVLRDCGSEYIWHPTFTEFPPSFSFKFTSRLYQYWRSLPYSVSFDYIFAIPAEVIPQRS
ncbi:hypothetical protein GALMADRAFT_1129272 [Galerina marginata CBS 339.88]|uniref:Uncharacterized protein n=1 Tax=Galerina marginata (strain CBS 339.88) TaxID=685588 RepID=A0A067SK21_GALM3|nr:hypothetical protein GALMADRAFT_1129272 [Galerina marginata CBS 339.88]